jgi:uncharacterized membrane protein
MRSLPRLVVVGGYILGLAALLDGLPAEIPPSWMASGGDVLWLGGPVVAFLLPSAVLITDWLLRGLCVQHPVDTASAAGVIAIYDAIMLRITIFIMGVHAAILLGLLGVFTGRSWAAQMVPVMLGLALISIGNLLPKTRPNLAIGIRTTRTLADRALWNRVHRAAGYLTVASGLALVVSALAVPRPIGPAMIVLVGPAALVGACVVLLWAQRKLGLPHVDG